VSPQPRSEGRREHRIDLKNWLSSPYLASSKPQY
jgi:hypothetical protein